MAAFLKKHTYKVNLIGIGLVILRLVTDPDMTQNTKMLMYFCGASYVFFIYNKWREK